MTMTNQEANEKTQFVPCTFGSNSMCVEDFGADSCCMFFKVKKENNDQTIEQLRNIEALQERGMPTKTSQPSKTFCVPTAHKDGSWPGDNDGELVNFNTNMTNPISFLPWAGM